MFKTIRNAAIAMMAMLFTFSAVQAEEIKPYVGAGAGGFRFVVTSAGVDNSGTSFGGFGILGASINDYIAVELRGGASTNADVSAGLKYKHSYFISYLAKLQYPVGDGVFIHALGGGTTANIKSTGLDTSKTGISFGGGIRFAVDDQLSFGAEWVRYWHNVSIPGNRSVDVDGISGTLRYNF